MLICIFSVTYIFAESVIELRGTGSHLEDKLSTRTQYVGLYLGGCHSNFNSRILPRVVEVGHVSESEDNPKNVEQQLHAGTKEGVPEGQRKPLSEKENKALNAWRRAKGKADVRENTRNLISATIERNAPKKLQKAQKAQDQVTEAQNQLTAAQRALAASKAEPGEAEALTLTQASDDAFKNLEKKQANLKNIENDIEADQKTLAYQDEQLEAVNKELSKAQVELSELRQNNK